MKILQDIWNFVCENALLIGVLAFISALLGLRKKIR